MAEPPGEESFAEIPGEWEIRPLQSLVVEGKATLDPRRHPEETFEYYSIPAYQESGKPLLELGGRIRSQKLLVESGTVLFGKLNPRVPKVWLVREESELRKIASTEFIPLVPRSDVDADFLYFLASSAFVLGRAQELVSGSTPSRQRVDPHAFFDLPVPVPPFPEQRSIAHVLRTIQRAREQAQQRQDALALLFTAFLQDLTTAHLRVDHLAADSAL